LRRCVPILALIPGALFGCEQRFSSDALSPENFAPLPSSGVVDAGAAPGAAAGPLGGQNRASKTAKKPLGAGDNAEPLPYTSAKSAQ